MWYAESDSSPSLNRLFCSTVFATFPSSPAQTDHSCTQFPSQEHPPHVPRSVPRISLRRNQILFPFPLLQAQVVPWKLWAAVAGLLAIDVILLLVWTLVDPLSREVGIAILQTSHCL